MQGALVMLVFRIGTLPAMLLTGIGAAKVSAFMRRRGTRLGMGLLIVALGVLTIAMPASRVLQVAG